MSTNSGMDKKVESYTAVKIHMCINTDESHKHDDEQRIQTHKNTTCSMILFIQSSQTGKLINKFKSKTLSGYSCGER